MSMFKQSYLEDPYQDIQKTSDLNNGFKQHNKKFKYLNQSYTSLFISFLNNNPHILKITYHNIVSFVSSIKQNQVIQETLLNNIDILGLLKLICQVLQLNFKNHIYL